MMFCLTMSLFVTSAFAQLKEVRGVQTRAVQYTEYNEGLRKEVTKWGYELKNENNYSVWVEMELKTNGFPKSESNYNSDRIKEGVRDTKNITLKAGETYVWKCDEKMRVNGRDCHVEFYITYKAYKAE